MHLVRAPSAGVRRSAAVRHGRHTLRPLESRLGGSIDSGGHGEHGGTLLVAGEAAVGELAPIPRRPALCSVLVSLTSGPQLSVTQDPEDSSSISDLNAVL